MFTDYGIAQPIAIGALASFLTCLLILATKRWHGFLSMDLDTRSQQKFHKIPVPRIGGVSMLVGLLGVAAYYYYSSSTAVAPFAIDKLLLAAAPAFLAGLLEDMTKKISILARMLATFASPLLASWLLGATLDRVDVWGVDYALQIAPVALIFTAFAVAGVSHSINIIDGFNGLAGFATLFMLSGLAYLAWEAGDIPVMQLAIAGIGAASGFLMLNYPSGRIFMGDCGAYLLGFWIAEIAVLIVARNDTINTWQVLAICAYPVIEVLYSIYRKKIVRHMNPGVPDRLHFHMLVYRRLVCKVVPRSRAQPWARNAMTTSALVLFMAPFAYLSSVWADTIPRAITLIVVQAFIYFACYARLVRGHWCLNPAIGFGFRPERARTKSM